MFEAVPSIHLEHLVDRTSLPEETKRSLRLDATYPGKRATVVDVVSVQNKGSNWAFVESRWAMVAIGIMILLTAGYFGLRVSLTDVFTVEPVVPAAPVPSAP